MEPRPLNKPQRPTTPATPAPSYPPVDRGHWSPSPPTPGYVPPATPAEPAYNPAPYSPTPYEPPPVRTNWYEPAPAGGSPPAQPPQGYSPGPALTPIDGGRGARVLGPLLALAVLAAVVIAVVFVVVRVFGDDEGRGSGGNLAASGTVTTEAVAAPTEAGTAVATEEPTETGAVAGADETAEPDDSDAAGGEETPEPTRTPEPDEGEAEPTRAPVSARSMLPTTGDLPDGFERTEDDKRVKEAVAASFSDSDEALANLNEWGWRENAYRTFEVPATANPDPNAMNVINISIHRFGTERGARDALIYFADDVIGTQGLEEFEIDRIGEQSRALRGAPDGANLVVLYVRMDNYLIRLGGYSPQGDPTDDVVAMAEQIVD